MTRLMCSFSRRVVHENTSYIATQIEKQI